MFFEQHWLIIHLSKAIPNFEHTGDSEKEKLLFNGKNTWVEPGSRGRDPSAWGQSTRRIKTEKEGAGREREELLRESRGKEQFGKLQ